MKKLVSNISLGADPELFLYKNGEIISAEGLIGGTKQKPKLISDKGHAIQEDNVMIEFNIPPSRSCNEFKDNINFVLSYLTTLAEVHNAELRIIASAELDKKYLNTKQAKLFGCDPDFNVYLKDINKSPNSSSTLRTCGGHIHIGYDEPSFETSEKIIYAMDVILGLESINLDKDDRRREMYGNAGCFRVKDYGVEYRTLSNFWLQNDNLIDWAYNKTLEAIELVNSNEIDDIVDKYGEDIKKAIDTNDKKLANKLIKNIKKIKVI